MFTRIFFIDFFISTVVLLFTVIMLFAKGKKDVLSLTTATTTSLSIMYFFYCSIKTVKVFCSLFTCIFFIDFFISTVMILLFTVMLFANGKKINVLSTTTATTNVSIMFFLK